MTHARYSDKRDANEAEIIAWLRERGCKVIQMPRGAGYDLQVFTPGGYILPPIEVKNPRYHWEYEKAEADLMVWCHDNGVEYWTITSLEDVEEKLKGYLKGIRKEKAELYLLRRSFDELDEMVT